MTNPSSDNDAEKQSEQQEAIVQVDPRCKVFVSRIPGHFTEDSVRRLIEASVEQPGSVVEVGLKYEEEEDDGGGGGNDNKKKGTKQPQQQQQQQHKGYAFLQFQTPEQAALAVQLGQVRGGAKEASTKKHTIYIRAVNRENNNEEGSGDDKHHDHICFLWQNHKCPYGDACKFAHEGNGGCLEVGKENADGKKKRKHCWDFRKGKCKLGDDCPFSHDFETKHAEDAARLDRPKSEKDCINWKTKGKCRKGDKCLYRHDEAVREKIIAKLDKKKRLQETKDDHKAYKKQQPLSVRVFGLNYETTEADVRAFFEKCGKISNITFPAFEDSGRSKGYCEVLFSSPKAVAAAVELNESKLHGRWLSIQAGKMYLNEWESSHGHDKKRRR